MIRLYYLLLLLPPCFQRDFPGSDRATVGVTGDGRWVRGGRGLVMHIREFLHTSGGLEQRLAAVSLYI